MVHIFEAIKEYVDKADLPWYTMLAPLQYPSSMIVTDHDGTEKEVVPVQVSKDMKYHLESLLRFRETELLNGTFLTILVLGFDPQERLGYKRNGKANTTTASQPRQLSFLTKEQQKSFLVEFFPRLPVIPKQRIFELCGTMHPQRVVLSGRPQHVIPPPPKPWPEFDDGDEVFHHMHNLLPDIKRKILGYLPDLHPRYKDLIMRCRPVPFQPTGCSEHNVFKAGKISCNGGTKYQASGFMFANKQILREVVGELGCYNMLTIEKDGGAASQGPGISPEPMGICDEKLEEESIGQIINLQRDMLILRGVCSEIWTAERLRAALTQQKAILKLKAIAIHVSHGDVGNILSSLKGYPNLELVFIVVDASAYRQPYRAWTNTHMGPENRISQDHEVMYEDIGDLLTAPELQDLFVLPMFQPLRSELASCKTISDFFSILIPPIRRRRKCILRMQK